MHPADRRPRDATEQLIEFAATGRLVDIDPRTRPRREDLYTIVLVVVVASMALGVGTTLLMAAARSSSSLATAIALSLVATSLALLLPSLRLVRLHQPKGAIEPRPGAVLPPALLRPGNWVYRAGAWARLEEIGSDADGTFTALLSSGEVIDLSSPLTVAGAALRPVVDPVASLRR